MFERLDTNKLVRGFAYALEIFILNIIQTVPNFLPRIFTVTPLLTAAACVTIAISESELAAMLFGLEAGLLLDISSAAPFGSQCIFFLVICAFLSAFSRRKIKIGLGYALTASFSALVCIFASIWFVQVFMSTSDGYLESIINRFLPMMIYTFLTVPLLYPVNSWIHRQLKNSAV